MLLLILLIPFAGGLLALLEKEDPAFPPRYIALVTLLFDLAVIIFRFFLFPPKALLTASGSWLDMERYRWIGSLGIDFFIGIDGLSLLLVLLTLFIGTVTIFTSWNRIIKKPGFFYFNILWTIGAMIGVFISLDMFLFYVFWELMLIPMYFIIALWGNEQRRRAALTFFIYTQVSGLIMLLSIILLVLIHARDTGELTFNYLVLRDSAAHLNAGWLVMMGFFAAFAVKMGIVPFHGWLPLTYAQAPAAGSILLAALMAKTGAYGFLRFVVPLFPESAVSFTQAALILGTVTVLYGAITAFGQRDIKRFIAWTSISHMGYILLAVFSWNTFTLQGSVMQMLAHGITTGAIFVLAASLIDRTGTRDISRMGGFWNPAPWMGAAVLIFALAMMGLPGTGNFIGEFLILIGTFHYSAAIASVATGTLIFSVIYALWLVHRVFQGPQSPLISASRETISDLTKGEWTIQAVLVVVLLWLGFFPSLFLSTSAPWVDDMNAIHVHSSMPSAEAVKNRLAGGAP